MNEIHVISFCRLPPIYIDLRPNKIILINSMSHRSFYSVIYIFSNKNQDGFIDFTFSRCSTISNTAQAIMILFLWNFMRCSSLSLDSFINQNIKILRCHSATFQEFEQNNIFVIHLSLSWLFQILHYPMYERSDCLL